MSDLKYVLNNVIPSSIISNKCLYYDHNGLYIFMEKYYSTSFGYFTTKFIKIEPYTGVSFCALGYIKTDVQIMNFDESVTIVKLLNGLHYFIDKHITQPINKDHEMYSGSYQGEDLAVMHSYSRYLLVGEKSRYVLNLMDYTYPWRHTNLHFTAIPDDMESMIFHGFNFFAISRNNKYTRLYPVNTKTKQIKPAFA